jgi:hypothetical protein
MTDQIRLAAANTRAELVLSWQGHAQNKGRKRRRELEVLFNGQSELPGWLAAMIWWWQIHRLTG